MPVPFYMFETTRVNGIMAALQDVRLLPQALRFVRRVQDQPATDGEIMARFTGYVTVADLIADDQAATVRQNGKFTLESNAVPNLKHGSVVTQEMLNMMRAINANSGITNDQIGFFRNYERNTIDGLRLGIEQRKEAMIVAMQLDAFSYSRLGISVTGASWGMPADLKVTPSTGWDTAGSATPVNDILNLQRQASVRYGESYNRMTMSLAAFNYMTATTEFQNRAKLYLPSSIPIGALQYQNQGFMIPFAQTVTGIPNIEIYDARYWEEASDGTLASAPYLPITKVILSDTNDDNNPNVMDFANGVVTESVVADLVPGQFGGFGGPQVGPISYVTGNPDMNPPQLTYWGVARGFPRKKRLSSTAVLTVGSFTDPISVGPPY